MKKRQDKAILIDVDDTILDFKACARWAMLSTAKLFGITLPEETHSVYIAINDELWKRIERGQLKVEEMRKFRWDMIFQKVGVKFDGRTFEKEFAQKIGESTEIMPGAREMIEYLYNKYPIYLASNAPNDQQRNRLTKLGLYEYFEGEFISGKIGFPKPQKEFFDYCFEVLEGLTPKDVYLIGDSPTADVIGAKKYGLKTIWFNHERRDESVVDSDYIIYSLDEIKEIL